jgi:uncharacterized protein (DUF1810 family)
MGGMTPDPFDLERFKTVQAPIYAQALRELRNGEKRTHWMWFVFPQIQGLGSSPMAMRYAIGSLAEARAYLADETLGPRLDECTRAMLSHNGPSATQILGRPDDLKFRSSMTLFDQVAPDSLFREALDRYFDGRPDERTLDIIGR